MLGYTTTERGPNLYVQLPHIWFFTLTTALNIMLHKSCISGVREGRLPEVEQWRWHECTLGCLLILFDFSTFLTDSYKFWILFISERYMTPLLVVLQRGPHFWGRVKVPSRENLPCVVRWWLEWQWQWWWIWYNCFRCAPWSQHEIWDPAGQPQGVLPRAAPTFALPQLPQSGRGRRDWSGPWGPVQLNRQTLLQRLLNWHWTHV